MGQIAWDSDITIKLTEGSTQALTYSTRSPFNEYAFAAFGDDERLWFEACGTPKSSDGVSSGDSVYIGSYAGLAAKHWLGGQDGELANLLPWQKAIEYPDSFGWIIEATDGSTDIDADTPFTLRANDGSGYLMAAADDANFLAVGGQASALVFKADTM